MSSSPGKSSVSVWKSIDKQPVKTGIESNLVQQLLTNARKAKSFAHCPYSGFRVGASILVDSDSNKDPIFINGCNVENSAYPQCICAEMNAVTTAISLGHKKFLAVAINTDVQKGRTTPCGGCRQIISEFGNPYVFIGNESNEYETFLLSQLLPYEFQVEQLSGDHIQKPNPIKS